MNKVPTVCHEVIQVNKTDKNPILQGAHIVGRQGISIDSKGKHRVSEVIGAFGKVEQGMGN